MKCVYRITLFACILPSKFEVFGMSVCKQIITINRLSRCSFNIFMKHVTLVNKYLNVITFGDLRFKNKNIP